ncbi:MAG: threonine aldolase family protein [Janthinobacterium lividum]
MIDLSSDTATKPSDGMRRAMANAEVGDEQRREDCTTNELQERVAEMLGTQAALFLPSATMSNLIALKTHLKPGDEFIATHNAHIVVWEGGGYAAVAGASVNALHTERGVFTGQQVADSVRPDDPHYARTRLVCVENTHNAGGGTVWTQEELEDVSETAKANGLAMHLDGARLMNAAAAANTPPREIASHFDSITLCLSKGLGCPTGAVLAGTHEFIEAAWRPKHMLGGAMRQSGVLAAAGLYALEQNLGRLPEDHQNAKLLAFGLSEIPGVQIDVSRVQSNLVFFSVDGLPGDEARARLEEQGVRMSGSYGTLRAVTHLDVSAADIETALSAARQAF